MNSFASAEILYQVQWRGTGKPSLSPLLKVAEATRTSEWMQESLSFWLARWSLKLKEFSSKASFSKLMTFVRMSCTYAIRMHGLKMATVLLLVVDYCGCSVRSLCFSESLLWLVWVEELTFRCLRWSTFCILFFLFTKLIYFLLLWCLHLNFKAYNNKSLLLL